MRRFFRRRGDEPLPPPGSKADEAATQRITAIREEQVPVPPRRRLPTLWPWLLGLLILALAGLAGAYLLARDDDDGETTASETASVPDVVGEQLREATRALSLAGFQTRVARTANERPRGIVLRQRPAAGAAHERGGTVTLAVSAGPATKKVPDLVGLTLAQASQRLEDAELRPTVRRVFSPRPRGRVIRQRPPAGTEIELEETVLLTVSKGPGRVDAPDAVGLTEAQALDELTSAGLQANVVRVSSSEPVGTVVAQNPPAGESVQRGSTVRLNVSQGPSGTTTTTITTTTTAPPTTTNQPATVPTRRVPNVVGLDEESARAQLRGAGFAVRTVPRDTTDPAEDGIVVDQQPAATARARAGSQVTITVGLLIP